MKKFFLVLKITKSDIVRRFASSYLGIFWVIGQPLLLSCAYILVFGIFMGDGLPGRRYGGASFVPYYMMGFCIWTIFADVLNRSATLLQENRSVVTKIKFPHEILSIQCILSSLIPFAVIFFIGLVALAYNGNLHWPVQFWYPLLSLGCLFLFTLGFSWTVAAIGVFINDLAQVISVLTMLWFFATPILYPADVLIDRGGLLSKLILTYNPMSSAVEMFRAPFFGLPLHWSNAFTWYVASSLLVFWGGRYVYDKLRKDFTDFL